MEAGPRSRIPATLFLVTFAAAFAALVWHCAAGPWWKDSGELASAFLAGSIAHPGGFAANAMLAGPLAHLPLGSLHFGVVLLSVTSGALASALLALLILGTSTRAWGLLPGLFGAAAFLLTRTTWGHSVAVEVYAPAAAFSAFALWNCHRYLEGPGEARARAGLLEASLLLGLSLGFHITATLVAGLAGLTILATSPWSRQTLRRLPAALGLALLGALVCLYLPLRFAAHPPHPFAAVEGLSGLLAHLSGSSIRGAFAQRMLEFSPLAIQDNANLFFGQLWDQCGLALPVVVAWLGWQALGRRLGAPVGRPTDALLLLVLMADALFSIQLNPMGQAEFQTGVLARFAVFALAGRGLLAALEAAAGLQSRLVAPALAALAGVLVLLLPLWPALSLPAGQRHPGLLTSRTSDEPSLTPFFGSPCNLVEGPTLYLESLWSAPPGALALTGLDDASALAIHGRVVENRRPDLFVAVKQFLTEPTLQVAARQAQPQFYPADYGQGPVNLRSFLDLARAQGRRVLWQRGQESLESARAGLQGAPRFPLESLEPRPPKSCQESPPVNRWLIGCRPDALGATVWSQDFSLEGLGYLEDCGEDGLEQAARQFARAVEMDPGNCKAWNNLAAYYGRSNQAQPALSATLRAVTQCPRNPAARVNELRYLYLTGNPEGARLRAPQLLDEVTDPDRARAMLQRLASQLRRGGLEDDARFLETLTR